MDGITSEKFKLYRGCVKGPKLFTIYLGELQSKIGLETQVVTFADDTYVLVSDKNVHNIKPKTELIISKHIEYLRSMEIIVNKSKTEILWIGNWNHLPNKACSKCYFSSDLKALGIYIDSSFNWEKQSDFAISKAKK